MSERRRATIALAASVLLALTTLTATVSTASAASVPGGSAGTRVAVTPAAPDQGPRSVSATTLTAQSSDCTEVRAQLSQYARKGQTQVGCLQLAPGQAKTRSADNAVLADVWCDDLGDNQYWYTRSSICLDGFLATYTLWDSRTGAVIGTAVMEIAQSTELSATSSSWTENVYLTMIGRTGRVTSLTVAITATCASPCNATKSSAWGTESITLGETESGTLQFSGNPSGQVSITPTYTITALAPGTIPVIPSSDWTLPDSLAIRCDNLVGSRAGCVVPLYTPTLMLSFSSDGASAVMIAWAQQYLPDKWGWEYGSGTPLRRLADSGLQATNRGIICRGFVPRSDVPDDSCDEFPFAATYESGAMLGLSGDQCAEVKPYIDDVTGLWYVAYINTVTGTERCVRGHVSLPSNTDVGGDLGRFAQDERVLDLEQYWVGTVY